MSEAHNAEEGSVGGVEVDKLDAMNVDGTNGPNAPEATAAEAQQTDTPQLSVEQPFMHDKSAMELETQSEEQPEAVETQPQPVSSPQPDSSSGPTSDPIANITDHHEGADVLGVAADTPTAQDTIIDAVPSESSETHGAGLKRKSDVLDGGEEGSVATAPAAKRRKTPESGATDINSPPPTTQTADQLLAKINELNARIQQVDQIKRLKVVGASPPLPPPSAGAAVPPITPPAAKKKMPTLKFSTGPAAPVTATSPPSVALSRTPRARTHINYADIDAGPSDEAVLAEATPTRRKPAPVASVTSSRQRKRSAPTENGIASAASSTYPSSSSAAFDAARRILDELMVHEAAGPFLDPVDWKRLGLPDYPKIIKQPMDLGTIKATLDSGAYTSVQQIADDVRLVWQNAISYNQVGSQICLMAQTLSALFEARFPAAQNLEDHTPNAKKRQLSETIRELNESMASLMKQLGDLRKQGVSGQAQSTLTNKKKPRNRKLGPRFYKTLTYEEKLALSDQINDLPPQHLGGVMAIVEEEMPAVTAGDASEVLLDIDNLETVLLRRLEDYVRSVLGSVSMNEPAVPAKPRPSTKKNQTTVAQAASATPKSKKLTEPGDSIPSPSSVAHSAKRQPADSSESDSSSDSDSDSELSEVAAPSHVKPESASTPDPVTPTTPAPPGLTTPVTLKNAETWSLLDTDVESAPAANTTPPVQSPANIPPVSPGGVAVPASPGAPDGQGVLWNQFHQRGIQKQQKERDKAEMEERLRKEKEEKERRQQEEEQRRKKEEEERERARLEAEQEQRRQQEAEMRRRREEERKAREEQPQTIDMMSQIVEMSHVESAFRGNN